MTIDEAEDGQLERKRSQSEAAAITGYGWNTDQTRTGVFNEDGQLERQSSNAGHVAIDRHGKQKKDVVPRAKSAEGGNDDEEAVPDSRAVERSLRGTRAAGRRSVETRKFERARHALQSSVPG
jgi:hypothetical protein